MKQNSQPPSANASATRADASVPSRATPGPAESESESSSLSGQTSIALLSRGLRLLSITQLRYLLREYSIPTGGNKESLVNRLIMYLETFGPSQQSLLVQFSLKLKRLLSTDSSEKADAALEESPKHLLPPEISDRLFSSSPSCLFETTEHRLPFGPVMVQAKMPSEVLDFTLLNQGTGCTPVLQLAQVFPDAPLKSVTLQLSGQVCVLSEPALWLAIPEVVNKPTSLQVMEIDPPVPIIVVIRWMRRVSVEKLKEMVIGKRGGLVDLPGPATSGICRSSRKVISAPARGTGCLHNDCFDLTAFLARASKTNDWMCPVCHKRIRPEDLRVDVKYFARMSVQTI